MCITTTLALLAACSPAPADLEPPVRLKAGDAYIDSGEFVAHSGPLFWDVSGDGKPDLLVGNFKGRIQVFHNVGTRREPVFEDKGLLQAEGEDVRIHNW